MDDVERAWKSNLCRKKQITRVTFVVFEQDDYSSSDCRLSSPTINNICMDIYAYQYALFFSDKLFVISMCSICMRTDDDVKLVQYLLSYRRALLHLLLFICMYVCMHIWLHDHFMFTTFSPLSLSLVRASSTLVHMHFYVYAIRCLRAKFYRLLVVSFMG